MELSQLVQQLPVDQLGRMQTLMHNMMAGHDVRQEMEEFEKCLPPSFRIRIATLMAGHSMGQSPAASPRSSSPTLEVLPPLENQDSTHSVDMNLVEARLTILRAVAGGKISPDEAVQLLFS